MEDQGTALTVDDIHTKNVDRTLKELQRMVKEHELALDRVCFRASRRIIEALLTPP